MAAILVLGFACPLKPRPLGPHNPTQAQNTTFNLKNAIAAYQTEYREYPLLDPANDLTIDSGHELMDILLGSDTQKGAGGRNPRGI
ncbi:MAG: hypothetical protein KDN18_11255, partial [Verrucomicrobiae bacterium]|nr:hypothetical protein [Verrucomicrobiae bacterium]